MLPEHATEADWTPYWRGKFAQHEAFRPGLYLGRSRRFRAFGRYYGYPSCCVEAFIGRRVKAPEGDWSGTGYIPCERCITKIGRRGFETFVKFAIRPVRRCKHPFPRVS